MSQISLISVFSRLEDPCNEPAQWHDLREMIVIALCAILCGAERWVDMAEWGEANETWLKKYLELTHGTAPHDTFSRVFRLKVFEACFREWVMSLVGVVEGVVAIDGKTAPGSQDRPNTALHMIRAYATASGLCLAQEGVRGKGKEIEGVKALLETQTFKGCIVTMDVLGCQTEIAQKMLERSGDYLLAVKENQPSLAEALRAFFDESETRAAMDACWSVGARRSRKITDASKHDGRCGSPTSPDVTD